MSEEYIFLSQRVDGKGSHFVTNMAEFLISKFYKLNLYYQLNYKICTGDKLQKCMYFKPIIQYSFPKEKIKEKIIKYDGGIRGAAAFFCENKKQDIISYFKENFKNQFYEIIKKESKIRNFNLPWKNNENIICIHIRLEDMVEFNPKTRGICNVTNRKDYDGRGSFNYVKNLIENKNFSKYNRGESDKLSLDKQAPIDPQKLIQFIEKFQKEYSEKKIYIITHCKVIPEWLDNIVNKYKIHIFHKNNDYYDLWLMIHSDILVLSKSTYSIIAGYYHQGHQVYYPYWGTNASLGLGSKYDNSGWIGYV